jgi:DNA-binding beta-propeller fold protein YncE
MTQLRSTTRHRLACAGLAVAAAASLGIAVGCGTNAVRAGQPPEAPLFEVDPFWPQPLPNHWLLGSAVGVAVDERDRIHVVHRTDSFNRRTEIGAAAAPPTGDCCLPAPNVLVFDAAGALVAHWGGPDDGRPWPAGNHRIAVAPDGSTWIGGIGENDAGFHRYARDGRHLGSVAGAALESIARAMDVAFDRAGGVAFVADAAGRRVVVLDANTGAVRRSWGAYGRAPDGTEPPAYAPGEPAATQFRNVHCVELANDGHVYVCDRESNRVQVFRSDGSYVTEKVIMPETLGEGAVWDVALSRDPQQAFLYVADGSNMRVHILDRRSLDVLTSFGTGGRQPGQFFAVHSIATDSEGNLYTAETYEGKRVQKFRFMGTGPVPPQQGVLWPRQR